MSEVQQIEHDENPKLAGDKKIVIETRPTTPEDLLYPEMIGEARRTEIARLGDLLQRLITLDVALMGGAMVGLKDDMMSFGWKIAVLICLLVSLIFAIIGSSTIRVNARQVFSDECREEVERVASYRSCWLNCSGGTMVLALLLAIFGLAFKAAA